VWVTDCHYGDQVGGIIVDYKTWVALARASMFFELVVSGKAGEGAGWVCIYGREIITVRGYIGIPDCSGRISVGLQIAR